MSICNSLLKHGYGNFSLEIIEYCDPSELLKREKYYIDLLGPVYNISKEPAAPMLGRNHSDEARKKIAVLHAGHFKKGHDANKGEKNPMFGKSKAEGAGRPSQKVEVFDKETNLTTTFDSFSAAAIALDIRLEVIKNYFARNQQKPYKGRYIFKK